MGTIGGNHRAMEPMAARRGVTGRAAQRMRAAVPVAGIVGAAVAGAAVIGGTPTLTAATELAAKTYYLRGTNIGTVPPDDQYAAWTDAVIDQTAGTHDPAEKVPYPGGFWFFSKGGFADPTYDKSVAEGLATLKELTGDDTGVIVYGYSQGAVVATEYKRETGAVGNTYVLVANPNRPNGGILERFDGVHIPIFDVSFNGATPTDGDTTYDIARQYDGWADFPKYPLNLLATANALLGIAFLHGKYDADIDPAVLDDPTRTDKSVHGNTTYYLVHTDRLPLLMPFEWIVPGPILDIVDAPLRVLVELGYDRKDYGDPQPAGLVPAVNPVSLAKDLGDVSAQGVATALAASTEPAATPAPASVARAALRSGPSSSHSDGIQSDGDADSSDTGHTPQPTGSGSNIHAVDELDTDNTGDAGDTDGTDDSGVSGDKGVTGGRGTDADDSAADDSGATGSTTDQGAPKNTGENADGPSSDAGAKKSTDSDAAS